MIKIKLISVFIVLLFLTACASQYQDATFNDPYGFFSGLLHGVLCLLSLLCMVISWLASFSVDIDIFSDIVLIGKPNTGFSYGLGYAAGIIISLTCL
jgi:hypothetical protein